MANYPNAAQIAAVSGSPMLRGLLKAVVTQCPALSHFYVSELEATRFLTLGIVGLPTGGFLNIGEGYSNGLTETALVEFNACRIGGAVEAQESPMLLYNKEKANGIRNGFVPDYFSLQAMGRYEGQLLTVENQIFKGVTNDAKGFPGLKALTPFVSGNTETLSTNPQDNNWSKSVLNVAGTTATTASSIYSVVYGELDAALVLGGPGGMANFLNMPAPTRVWKDFTDPVDSVVKKDWFHVSAAEGYIGLSVMGGNQANASRQVPQWSVRRAANVTADSGKTCTDSVLEALEAMFPPGKFPNVHFMSYRSRKQLQDSRSTAINFNMSPGDAKNGTYAVTAPLPTTSRAGVPIVVTQAIGNTDAIES